MAEIIRLHVASRRPRSPARTSAVQDELERRLRLAATLDRLALANAHKIDALQARLQATTNHGA